MTKHLQRYLDIYVINIVTIFFGLCLYEHYCEPEIPIAIFATGISISIGFRQYKIEDDKMFKDLFMMFNRKYDKKFNESLNSIESSFRDNPNYELTSDEWKLVIDYLNLCAEEYLWYNKGRIDESVWKSWEAGMKFYLSLKPIRKCVDQQMQQKDSYYGLFERLAF